MDNSNIIVWNFFNHWCGQFCNNDNKNESARDGVFQNANFYLDCISSSIIAIAWIACLNWWSDNVIF